MGAGILSSLAFAGPSLAAAPNAGVACQTDGKIAGRGATFQKNSQNDAFAVGYRDDVCGPVPGGEPGDKMVIYNYSAAESRTPPLTGSGSGITGARCRTDAFNGSDVPYTQAQLTGLRAAPPAPTDADCVPYNNAASPFNPPFQPTGAPYPATADVQAPIMSFPVAGGAVAIGVNLPASECGGTAPVAIQLSTLNASRLWGGQIATWNDAQLVADNPDLANCTGAVRRNIRSDNSGTTTIFKNYLKNADGARPLCDGTTWSARTGQAGNNFPTGGSCSALASFSGNPAVVSATAATPNSVGYGDLSEWLSLAPSVLLASVRAADGSSFVDPVAVTGSNCSFSGAQLPSGGQNGAVGLNASTLTTWASDGSPNRSDVTFRVGSAGYPICGFTWDLVYTGLARNGASATAVSRLNANQRRTLYSYMTYILSPTGQDRLSAVGYAPLPSAFLTTLRRGFQANF